MASVTFPKLLILPLRLSLLFMTLLATLTGMAANADSGRRLLVIGDSISAGFGVPVQKGWVTLLDNRLQQTFDNLSVINASVSGDTTQGGVARLPALLQQHQPDLVMIELGGNDGLRGTPLPVIRNNLDRMIQTARQKGAEVMLLGMQIPPNYGQRYANGFANLFAELADQHDTLLVPFLLQDVAIEPGLMQSDGIHPTTEAQPIMMQHVIDTLLPWLETSSDSSNKRASDQPRGPANSAL